MQSQALAPRGGSGRTGGLIGWLSLGLGLTQVVAPGAVTRLIGARDNGLALTTGALFLAFAVGTLFVGTAGYNNELAEHGQATIPLRSYVVSGHFLEALFENRMA